MKCTLVGSRYFGTMVLEALRKDQVEILRVVVPAAGDRLALAAHAAGLPINALENPKIVPGSAIAPKVKRRASCGNARWHRWASSS